MNTLKIYLTNKNVTKDEWKNFIETICDYVGILKKWNIIISIDKNKIRYYLRSKCTLPPTINNNNSFTLKSVDYEYVKYSGIPFLFTSKIGANAIDILEYYYVRKKGNIKLIDISICKIYDDKIIYKIILITEKNSKIFKYRVIFSTPYSILSINFEKNNRYFFDSTPKYLDISKVLHLINSDIKSSILKVDTFPYVQGDYYLNQNRYDFNKHSVIIGSSGSGKSKFISLFIKNIYKNIENNQKYKIVVIDPHASLENDIGGIGKVIDFKKPMDSIDLFINEDCDVVSTTELLLDLFKSLFAHQYNSKLERVLRHSTYVLLTKKAFNFNNLRTLLLDLEYRNNLLKKLKSILPVSIIDFFLSDFNELKTKSYSEAISPIISFIDEMQMIPIFNSTEKLNNLKNTINDNFLTLFSLDRVKLSDKVTKTISGLIYEQLLTLIQSYSFEEHIIFIVDEVAVIENDILSRFLSEARKYNLSIILCGQYFNQISTSLKNAIFANVINYYIFKVSKLDAKTLVENFNMKVPLDDTIDRKVKMLTQLDNRECIIRVSSNGIVHPAFKAKTLEFESIPRIKGNIKPEESSDKKVAKKKVDFKIDDNIDIKDILIKTSSGRKIGELNE